jgi:hypothetical protein
MSLTLDEVLDTAGALDERLATVRDPHEQTILEHKKAHVDFAAFGLFKAAHLGQALGDFGKPLAWGVGLGLPALGVGHALLSDAHRQGDALIENARNQAMLTALGVGGLKALGGAAQSLLAPRGPTEPDGFKLGADRQGLQKLAALLLLDDVLEREFAAADGHEKQALAECLFINRAQGTALLRKLRR